jgi:hypothetical protein
MVHEAVKFIVFGYYSDRRKTADKLKDFRNFAKTALIIRIIGKAFTQVQNWSRIGK